MTADAFSFSLIGDLGKYHDVPLHYQRISSRFFSHVTSKLLEHLSTWKAKSLSLARRLTLCSSILATTPLYAMQTTNLSQPVCDNIDGISRSFL